MNNLCLNVLSTYIAKIHKMNVIVAWDIPSGHFVSNKSLMYYSKTNEKIIFCSLLYFGLNGFSLHLINNSSVGTILLITHYCANGQKGRRPDVWYKKRFLNEKFVVHSKRILKIYEFFLFFSIGLGHKIKIKWMATRKILRFRQLRSRHSFSYQF